MTFDEYQKQALSTDLGQFRNDKTPLSPSFIAAAMGLPGEAGEFIDKLKKVYRDDEGVLTSERKAQLLKELGDVMWYVAVIADYLDTPLSELADSNISKLSERKDRDTLSGSGDDR